jgi:hypothetical protein
MLVVEPLGLELGLPVEWFGVKDTTRRPANCGHDVRGPLERRFVTTTPVLASLLNAGGEWDREYSAVTDTILPFANLVAHLGPESFGSGGGCFGDLQMRVYVLPDPSPVLPRARGAGLRTARGFFQTAQIASRDSAQWRIVRLSWDAWYHDYGGEANVEIFTTPFRGHNVALVFMHASWPMGPAERDRRYILEHVVLR